MQNYSKEKVSKFKKLIYPLTLIGLWITIVLTNYTPNSWLTGWDNQHFEFNLGMNLNRLLSAPWAEYQGMGAPGAHSHAADLPRIFIVGILDIFLDPSLVRYAFIFGCLLVGTLGIYYLVLNNIQKQKKYSIRSLTAFASALIFMLHVGTVQHFVVPFEMFTVQFAMLPWIFNYLIKYLYSGARKHLFIYALCVIFAAPMAYASLLWFAFFGSLTIYLLIHYFLNRSGNSRITFKHRSIKLWIITIGLNLFWLLPTIYYIFKHSGLVPGAKTNIIFSPEAFLANQKYGNLGDLALHKGFLFEWNIRETSGRFQPLMNEWSEHLNLGLITAIGLFFFIAVVLGILVSLKRKDKFVIPFLGIFTFGVIMLLGTNPPFGFIFEPLINIFSFVEEAFRFPFTKFSLITLFPQAIFFGIGIGFIAEKIGKKISIPIEYIVALFVLMLFFIYAIPSLRGNFIHPSMRIDIPNEYFEAMDYFKKQDPNTRVANLPIDRLFGWFYTEWGYQGSGFMWYGAPQAFLDRDFDRWYSVNEDYYDEMSTALYTSDIDALETVISKYDIDWILIDGNITTATEQSLGLSNTSFDRFGNRYENTLAINEIETLLDQLDYVSLEENFGKISIYKVDNDSKSYVNVYNLNSNDSEFDSARIYPFFDSNIQRKTESFTLESDGDKIHYSKSINLEGEDFEAVLPSIAETEESIPVNVSARIDETNSSVVVQLRYLIPSIKINGFEVFDVPEPMKIEIPTNVGNVDYILTVNDYYHVTLNDLNTTYQNYGVTTINTQTNNTLGLFNAENIKRTEVTNLFENAVISDCANENVNEENDIFTGSDSIKLYSEGGNICLSNVRIIEKQNTPSLNIVDLEFQSTTGQYPNYCVRIQQDCLNNPMLLFKSNSRNWFEYNDFIISPKDTDIYMDIVLNNDFSGASESIGYRNMNIKSYPLVESYSFRPADLPESIKKPINQNLLVDDNEFSIEYTLDTVFSDYTFDYDKLSRLIDSTSNRCRGNEDGKVDKIIDSKSETITYYSHDEYNCENINLINFPVSTGFLIELEGNNISGLPIQVNINDLRFQKSFYSNRLPSENNFKEIILIPRLSDTNSVGLNIFLNNQSIGDLETINTINSLKLIPFNYNWLNKIYIKSDTYSDAQKINKDNYEVSKFGTFFYQIKTQGKGSKIIELAQSYESNWVSIDNGSKVLKDTNTRNIWALESSENTITIIYLPQILLFIGIAGSVSALLLAFYKKR